MITVTIEEAKSVVLSILRDDSLEVMDDCPAKISKFMKNIPSVTTQKLDEIAGDDREIFLALLGIYVACGLMFSKEKQQAALDMCIGTAEAMQADMPGLLKTLWQKCNRNAIALVKELLSLAKDAMDFGEMLNSLEDAEPVGNC